MVTTQTTDAGPRRTTQQPMDRVTPVVPGAGERERRFVSMPLGEIFRHPLPHLQDSLMTRVLTRGTLALLRGRIIEAKGLEHVRTEDDPFILVLNHSQRLEALLVPALLFYLRGGKRVHFMADWNFCLIPFVALFYRCGQTITLVRKPARPRFLNVFRPWFADAIPGLERARQRLAAGAPVAIFSEGTVNRDRQRLLKGYSGAARLSLETGVPVVPAGIRFPTIPAAQPLPPTAPFTIEFGERLAPPAVTGEPGVGEVREWHGRLMCEIGRLSGKQWQFDSKRR